MKKYVETSIAFLLLSLLTACPTGGSEVAPPKINEITIDPQKIEPNDVVIYKAQLSSTSGEGPYNYVWDLGNGTGSTSKSPTAKYDMGQYAVTVKVSNNGGSDEMTKRITVENKPPEGDVYFWTNTNIYGAINVTMNNATRTINVMFPQFPGCVKNLGNADFIDIEDGNYTYQAISQTGAYWNGSVTVINDGCESVLLN